MLSPDLHVDQLDRSGGMGSRNFEEDWIDANTTAAENEWSTAATTFRYWEAPPHLQHHFQALYDKQHGWGEEDRTGSIRRSHIVKDAKTFTDILELPEYQRDRIISIAEDFNFSSKKFGGKPYEKILLAICSLVSDEELTRQLDHQNVNHDRYDQRIILTDEFKELMDANNLGSREHNRIRQMLRDKTDQF